LARKEEGILVLLYCDEYHEIFFAVSPGHLTRGKTPVWYSPNFPQSPEAQRSGLFYLKDVKLDEES
jgi:hypothetical protein